MQSYTYRGAGAVLVLSADSRGARAPQEFKGSEKGQSLISAYRSLAITTNTPGRPGYKKAIYGAACYPRKS